MSTPETTPIPAATSDEKIWIIFCHLSLLLGVGFVLPLVVYLVKKNEGSAAAAHAKEALNFHISVCIYLFVSFILCFVFIGIPMLFIVGIGAAVCAIIACKKASDGGFYRYPLTLRLI
jgi:uncharacterized Tic20 family protein